MEETATLFAKPAPISLKLSVSHHGGKEATKEPLHRKHPAVQVTMSMKTLARHKALHIQLTDENDPFFFFDLEISEEDFHALKQEQNLLIDFLQFPAKFIELLEACIGCGKDEHPK